ncbi:MAG: aminoglycoside adenylyltransferase domain-containing protein [Anaerolineae bacterium]
MLKIAENPTPYPEVTSLLKELFGSVQAILGDHLIGMYLDGSLATGGFDKDSDIDFIVVTDLDVDGGLFLALQAMHDRIATLDTIWAIQLEGSYFSQQALRRWVPTNAPFPNIERGVGERLKMVPDGVGWIIHRCVLREQGIVLAGPDPRTLVDPISPADLQQAMLGIMPGWGAQVAQDLEQIRHRGFQSYVVLTVCRILYTLQHGAIASKTAAARWAQETLDARWLPLLESAWQGRHHQEPEASMADVQATRAFIAYAQERSRQFEGSAES